MLLLHGIARAAASMRLLERAFAAAGYATLNLDYPARRFGIASLAQQVRAASADWARNFDRLHVVTHSMGGLVARAMIALDRPANLGRVVVLAPPNMGSEIADLVGGFALYRRFFGPAGADLATRRSQDLDALLGPADYELGILAGTRAFDPSGWLVLPKPNDGRVTVAATRLPGMADHLVLPATHTFIMRHPDAIRACLAFLRSGGFTEPDAG